MKDTTLNKVTICSNKKFRDFIIKKANIEDEKTIAVAYWETPALYYDIKRRYPEKDVYYIENIENKGLYGDIENAIYVNSEEEFPNMHFDKVIMNPPYGKTLHLKILNEVIKHCDDVINLSPGRWLQDPLKELKPDSPYNKYKNITNRIADVSIIPARESQKLFGAGIWNDLFILHITKNGGYDLNKLNQSNESLIDKLILPAYFKNGISNNKLITKDTSGPFVKVSYLHGHIGTKDMCDWVSPQRSVANSTNLGSGGAFRFSTQAEADNFFDYLQLKAVKFINALVKVDMNVPWGVFPYTNDYTQPWTNQRFCEYFGITGFISDTEAEPGSEWEEIINTMKAYM